MTKPKVYTYGNRTFEVEVYGDAFGLLSIYVNEVIRPNRRFFGRTRFFCDDFVFPDQYLSIDDAIKEVIERGLWQEEYKKFAKNQWKDWIKKTRNC